MTSAVFEMDNGGIARETTGSVSPAGTFYCTFKPQGGHIFAGVHNLPPDMPEDHLRAFFTAWTDYRDY
jgi:uroporphyrinogen-III decarboxylase